MLHDSSKGKLHSSTRSVLYRCKVSLHSLGVTEPENFSCQGLRVFSLSLSRSHLFSWGHLFRKYALHIFYWWRCVLHNAPGKHLHVEMIHSDHRPRTLICTESLFIYLEYQIQFRCLMLDWKRNNVFTLVSAPGVWVAGKGGDRCYWPG